MTFHDVALRGRPRIPVDKHNLILIKNQYLFDLNKLLDESASQVDLELMGIRGKNCLGGISDKRSQKDRGRPRNAGRVSTWKTWGTGA